MKFSTMGGVISPIFFLIFCINAHANQLTSLPKMKLMGVFDAGQPGAVIIKIYDEKEDIFCYVLMPENAVKRNINGVLTYDGNNIGSISCVAPTRRPINFDLKR